MAKREEHRLTRTRIVDAARHVVDREGLEALSMRRLAQELDVWPMSVYRHFRDKDDLLDALVAAAAGELDLRPVGASWRGQMRELLGRARETMASEVGSRLPRAFLTPGVLRLSEAGLGILAAAGFSTRDAARAWRALWSYTFGFSTFAVAPSADETRRRARSAIAALDEAEYPALTGAADELASVLASDEEFGRGLDRLLDGLEAASKRRA
jgi:AcrR family transcriptional regulator